MKVYGYMSLEGYFDKPTGVGKHAEQMFRGLAATPGVEFTVLAARDQLDAAGQIPSTHTLAGLPAASIPYPRKTLERRWSFISRPIIDPWCDGADWIYSPIDRNIATRRHRLAPTVHSLYWFDPECPGYRSLSMIKARLRYGRMFRRVIKDADRVLTVSEFLKKQIVEWYGRRAEDVVVVGNGAEREYFEAGQQPRGRSGQPADRPYVVCVSGLNTLDGAPYVLAAAKALRRLDPDIRILVAGHQNEPQYMPEGRGIGNLEFLDYVPKERLAALMRDSVALLFLNRYETFGMGAAEAMAAGTPVIGTSFTAVPEIVGGAGVMVNPDDPEEVARRVVELARDDTMRQRYIDLGLARAQQHTWAACLARLVQALRS